LRLHRAYINAYAVHFHTAPALRFKIHIRTVCPYPMPALRLKFRARLLSVLAARALNLVPLLRIKFLISPLHALLFALRRSRAPRRFRFRIALAKLYRLHALGLCSRMS